MLSILTRKFCPLLSLFFALTGCGKQIREGSAEAGRTVTNQELPSDLVLRLNSEANGVKEYQIPRNANIYLPKSLQVRMGEPTGETVVISYNIKDGDDFDYQCTYNSSSNPLELPLKECINAYGERLTEVTSFEFPIYYGRIIKLKLQGKVSGLVVDAVYNVDWK
jgi:hypothetical protein